MVGPYYQYVRAVSSRGPCAPLKRPLMSSPPRAVAVRGLDGGNAPARSGNTHNQAPSLPPNGNTGSKAVHARSTDLARYQQTAPGEPQQANLNRPGRSGRALGKRAGVSRLGGQLKQQVAIPLVGKKPQDLAQPRRVGKEHPQAVVCFFHHGPTGRGRADALRSDHQPGPHFRLRGKVTEVAVQCNRRLASSEPHLTFDSIVNHPSRPASPSILPQGNETLGCGDLDGR